MKIFSGTTVFNKFTCFCTLHTNQLVENFKCLLNNLKLKKIKK